MLSVSGLETREDHLPFAIGSRAHIVAPTVLWSPVTFVERGVGRAFGRTGAFLNLYTMKVISVVSVILAQAAALVRTIHVVREEFAVSGRLAYRLAGLRGQRAIGKARRGASASCRCPGILFCRRLPRRFAGRGQARGPGRLAWLR